MVVGVVPELSPARGGIYQYGLTVLDALASGGDRSGYVVLAARTDRPEAASLAADGWRIAPLQPPAAASGRLRGLAGRVPGATRLRRALRGSPASAGEDRPDPDVVRRRPDVGAWQRSLGIELVLYPSPRALAFEAGVPYVMAVHDIQHRLQPEFPEVSADGEWERREYVFRNAARHATLLVADSEVGREDLLEAYGPVGLEPERVKVLPFVPPPHLGRAGGSGAVETLRRHGLSPGYLFYPAQLWPHKNHVRLVRALGVLRREHGLEPQLVLCGGSGGALRSATLGETLEAARAEEVESQVRYLGYVPDEEIAALYEQAAALVMPTFFGPTNIPILEAWSRDCPVLTSDIRGVREQAGDAAALADPTSVEALAAGIAKLLTDTELRALLVARGRQRLAAFDGDEFRRRLLGFVDEARARVRAGGEPPGMPMAGR